MKLGKALVVLFLLAAASNAGDQKAAPSLDADLKALVGEWVQLKDKGAQGEVRLRFDHFARRGNTVIMVTTTKKDKNSY